MRRRLSFRPFRAGDIVDHWTQGVALGYHIWPRWGQAPSAWSIAWRAVVAVAERAVVAVAGRAVDAVTGRAVDAVTGRAVDAVTEPAIAAVVGRFVVANRHLKAPKGRHLVAQGNALG